MLFTLLSLSFYLIMKYLIASDIHGSETALDKVIDYFHAEQCDMLLLLGDLLNFGPRNGIPEGHNPQAVAQKLNALADRIIAIRGNCDSEVDQMLLNFPIMADYALIVDEGKRLLLTHGHKYTHENTGSLHFDALFYGHTHVKELYKSTDGKIICNVGSVTFPKAGNPPSFAVYEAGRIKLVKV